MQNYERTNYEIKSAFIQLKKEQPQRFQNRLKLSWSNWGFGLEDLEISIQRLSNNGLKYIELHGNHYGDDMGYKSKETLEILKRYNMEVSGVCGMFSAYNDMSSNKPHCRQSAIDYIKRELAFCEEVHARYMLVVPGAVGRPSAYDSTEFERSVETLKLVADLFGKHHVKCAIEPIRAAEVSLIHTFSEAKQYINAVDSDSIKHINGDVYHMLVSESHIGKAIVDAGSMLVNLHMADTNRCALGAGFLDLDTIIMALYLIDYNNNECFVTPEPLGPGGDPYPAMNGKPNKIVLDKLVSETVSYFREREKAVLSFE